MSLKITMISSISPFFIVADVPAALSFYRDMLGFEVTFRGPTPDDEFFGIVRRDGAMIMVKALGVISDGKEVTVEPVPAAISPSVLLLHGQMTMPSVRNVLIVES